MAKKDIMLKDLSPEDMVIFIRSDSQEIKWAGKVGKKKGNKLWISYFPLWSPMQFKRIQKSCFDILKWDTWNIDEKLRGFIWIIKKINLNKYEELKKMFNRLIVLDRLDKLNDKT